MLNLADVCTPFQPTYRTMPKQYSKWNNGCEIWYITHVHTQFALTVTCHLCILPLDSSVSPSPSLFLPPSLLLYFPSLPPMHKHVYTQDVACCQCLRNPIHESRDLVHVDRYTKQEVTNGCCHFSHPWHRAKQGMQYRKLLHSVSIRNTAFPSSATGQSDSAEGHCWNW